MASICTLPAEIQLLISGHCNHDDHLSLRQAHRSWFEVTTDLLFSSYSLTYLTWSFDRLEELSRSRLAHYVKHLNIYSESLGEVESEEDFQSNLQLAISQACYCVGDRGYVYYLAKEHWPEAWKTYQKYFESQQRVHTEALYLSTMKESLRRLKSLESVAVEFFEEYFDPRTNRYTPRWRPDKTSLELEKIITCRVGHEYDHTHPTSMPNLVDCLGTTYLRKLTIQQQYTSVWDASRLQLDCLEELELEISRSSSFVDKRDMSEQKAEEEMVALAKTQSLRKLTIRTKFNSLRSTKQTAFDLMIRSHHWPHLKTLRCSEDIAGTALEAFCERHSHTLQDLVLHDCSISGIVDFLKQLPMLVKLSSVDIRNIHGWTESGFGPYHFPVGLDPATRAWLLTGQGVPVFEPWRPPPGAEDWNGGCFGPDPNADIVCDYEFEDS